MTCLCSRMVCLFYLMLCIHANGQPHTIDISHPGDKLVTGHLTLGINHDPDGNVLSANSLYFTKNGKPWYPVMGEFHFSRFPKEQWEESILKMKAAGIDIIATYVFWIYHEEEEGKWNWTDNFDLRGFVSLCKKHGMYVLVRIGPWCHGEVRNGGFPDWLLKKQLKTRTNDPLYLDYVKKFYNHISLQLEGSYFKDGGPVIGAQIENEFRFNNAKGWAHITTLLDLAKQAHIDVPFYTATGWPGSNIHQNELIPVWGAYPEAPWDKRTTQLPPSPNYLFDTLRSDPAIGNDLNGNAKDTNNYAGYRYPYGTAEMGGGIQITYHRRPIIGPKDVLGLALAKIGSGANLVGYYMFHGGHNPVGKLSTLQESKASAYPNDYPILNYDFQAPIGEWGQLRPSYSYLKLLHLFLNDLGDKLAVCDTYFPAEKVHGPSDSSSLRWSVRSKDGNGFIFINNYQRQVKMQPINGVRLNLKMPAGSTMQIPEKSGLDIPADCQAVWPINLMMGNVLLKYATLQPLCILHDSGTETYVFFENEDIKGEYVICGKEIADYAPSKDVFIEKENGFYTVKPIHPDKNCLLRFNLKNGKHLQIITLTQQQALEAWKVTVWGKERLILSNNDLIVTDNKIQLQQTGKGRFQLDIFPKPTSIAINKNVPFTKTVSGIFCNYVCELPEKKCPISWKENTSLATGLDPAMQSKIKGADSVHFSMPLYNTTLQSVPDARYYDVHIPKNALDGLANAFLKIDYSGDTEAFYLDNKLVADDFYYGMPATVGLKSIDPALLEKNITILITPLKEDSKIFFEKGLREKAARNGTSIKSIELLPEYQMSFTGRR